MTSNNAQRLIANAILSVILLYPIVLDEHLNKIHCRVTFPKKIIIFQGNLLVTLPII